MARFRAEQFTQATTEWLLHLRGLANAVADGIQERKVSFSSTILSQAEDGHFCRENAKLKETFRRLRLLVSSALEEKPARG